MVRVWKFSVLSLKQVQQRLPVHHSPYLHSLNTAFLDVGVYHIYVLFGNPPQQLCKFRLPDQAVGYD